MTAVCLLHRQGSIGKIDLVLALVDFLSGVYRKTVLLVDLDPDTQLSLACVGEERWQTLESNQQTLADAFDAGIRGERFTGRVETVQRIAGAPPVQLLVGSPRLSDREAEALESEQHWRHRVDNPYSVLSQALASWLDGSEPVLIHCPPTLGLLTLNGLMMAQGHLVPVTPSPLALSGLSQLVTRIDGFATRMNHPLRSYGTLIQGLNIRSDLHVRSLFDLEGMPEVAPLWSARVSGPIRSDAGVSPPLPLPLSQRWTTAYPELLALTEEFTRRIPESVFPSPIR